MQSESEADTEQVVLATPILRSGSFVYVDSLLQ
jgi:hypothetical protein